MNNGFSINEYTAQITNGLKNLQQEFYLNEEEMSILKSHIDNVTKQNFKTTKGKGDALEDFIEDLLNYYGFYEVMRSHKTSTNEIDLRCDINSTGNSIKRDSLWELPQTIYIECKNTKKKPDVGVVSKIAQNVIIHEVDLGIIISIKPLTGKGWEDAIGLTKKIFLKHHVYIISITIDELSNLDQYTLWDIIEKKRQQLQHDFCLGDGL